MENKYSRPCGRAPEVKKPKASRKKTWDLPGQYSFMVSEDNTLTVDDPDERLKADTLRRNTIAYYKDFLVLLAQYGKFNSVYGLWNAFEDGNPSPDAMVALRDRYDGDLDELQIAMNRRRHWLKRALEQFAKSAHKVNLFEVTDRYDEACRDPKRRDKFKRSIKRELKKVKGGQTTEVFSPRDFEDEYQIALSRKAKKSNQETP